MEMKKFTLVIEADYMVTTNKFNQDPNEDVLKQLLAEVVELRQKIEINASQRLQKYQDNFQFRHFFQKRL
jgi:hypothetical protein